jgi:hypothetical protein
MAQVKTSTPTPAPGQAWEVSAPTATWVPTLTATPAWQVTPGPGDVLRIGPADAWARAEAGEAVFVDVRVETEYKRAHVPGAISLPPGSKSGFGALPGDRWLIFYCA